MSSTNTTTAAIIGQFIEKLVDSDVSYDDRIIVYQKLLDVLEDFTISPKDIDNCCSDIDSAFDEAWNEKYPELLEETDD
jgi:hypothetical protein